MTLKIDGDVRRLQLQPGDLVVLTVPDRVTNDTARQITEQMRELVPDHRVMILDGGMEISVATPEELAAATA